MSDTVFVVTATVTAIDFEDYLQWSCSKCYKTWNEVRNVLNFLYSQLHIFTVLELC